MLINKKQKKNLYPCVDIGTPGITVTITMFKIHEKEQGKSRKEEHIYILKCIM